jgi:hypothetical protein
MNNFLVGLLVLASVPHTFANTNALYDTQGIDFDLTSQMNQIIGDWNFKGSAIFRIQAQSDRSIKVYACDRSDYFNSTNRTCNYNWVKIYNYRSDLDAFFAPPGKTSSRPTTEYCSESLQVSLQNPTELMRVIDPYFLGPCRDTGLTEEARKL